nr:uncharacterized mitochondrial protein AtMg00810-like [Tanacetum cinerariifolium]
TTPAPVKAVEANCVTCGGTLSGNTVTNQKEELKGITTRSGVACQGPKTPSPSKQGTKVKDKQENDKIRSKPDKNEMRGEAVKSQKQLHINPTTLLGSTKFFTNSIKHLVFFFKFLGSINSKANSCKIKRINNQLKPNNPPTTTEEKLERKNELKAREEMDLKWQMAMLIMRARRFLKNTGRKVDDRYKIGEWYHAVPPPYTGNFIPPKPDLILTDVDDYVVSETVASVPAVATNEAKTSESKPKSVSEPIIEDWVSDSEDENETKTKQIKPSFAKVEFVKPNKQVKTPRESVKQEKHNKQAKHPRKNSQSPREIDGGYVAFGGDPKGGKITAKDTECVVLSPDFKLLDESQVLLRVTRKNNMYIVDFKNVAPSGGKFDRKADVGFFVGYSMNSKVFRVFNSRTRIVDKTLHINFLENKPNIAESELTWNFDIDTLIKSMNYTPVVARNQSNGSADKARVEIVPDKDYTLLPLWTQDPLLSSSFKDSSSDGFKPLGEEEKKNAEDPRNEDNEVLSINEPRVNQEKNVNVNNTNNINTVSQTDNAAGTKDNVVDENIVYGCADDPNMPNLEEIIYSDDDDDVGAEADMTNLDTNIPVIQQRINHKDFQNCLFACFLSQVEPKKVIQALTYPSWIEAMQDDLLQFKLHQVWTLVDLPNGKRAIGTKWIFKNKKDERVSRIEAIRMFLAYTSFKDFVVYQMDVKSAFMSTKKEMCTEIKKMMHKKFQMSSIGELIFFLGLQVTQKDDEIFISQDKYVHEILKKFGFSTVKTASTPMKTLKPLIKDENAEDIDVYLYRSMIGSLLYLISSRRDIMFAICACARFQVTPKVSHFHAVKRIFRYLKGQPKLGLWYPKDSPFDLEAYTDSDYAGASLDRKSTTKGCQFLGRRLISWQCKKQTVVANSITKAEYVAASNCCRQVLWIQNQKLDYGYNFMIPRFSLRMKAPV